MVLPYIAGLITGSLIAINLKKAQAKKLNARSANVYDKHAETNSKDKKE